MNAENSVAAHYAHGDLQRAILDALVAAGKDPEHVTVADLAPADEFHIGGRQATIDFAAELGAARGMHLIDIGSGIGGASRYFASALGARVTGVDLSDEYVGVAADLARRCGLAALVSYRQASATALPFANASFDGAYMLHVGMNIADKAKLFAEVRRVLKPAGAFGLFEVMRASAGELVFPLPWASGAEHSFVETAPRYRELLTAAGFTVTKERDRTAFALESFRRIRAQAAVTGRPPLGLHIVMGADAGKKAANLVGLLERGVLAPVEMIARAG